MDKQIFRLLGKSISLAAMAYRVRMGRAFNRPPVGRSYTETFLYMLDYLNEGENYRPNPVIAKALDVLFILHADHVRLFLPSFLPSYFHRRLKNSI
jgi:citrate synthase